MLLEYGSDANLRESIDRYTPAFQTTSIPILQCLMSYGLNINAQSRSGETILHGAVQKGDQDLVAYLLSNGANINVAQLKYRFATTNILHSFCEQTPLQMAAEENHFHICRMLLQHGCKVDFLLDPENSGDMLLRIINTTDICLAKTLVYCAGNWDWTRLVSYTKLSHFNGKENLDAVWNWIVFYSKNVLPLKALCRLMIRKHYKTLHRNTSIFIHLTQIPMLPDLLKRYLVLEYIE